MQPLRAPGKEAECGKRMRQLQARAEGHDAQLEKLPTRYRLAFSLVVGNSALCVSCFDSATQSCALVRQGLAEARAHLSAD